MIHSRPGRTALFLFVMSLPAVAGAQASDWWSTAPADETRESGKLHEIATKRRVFVDIVYTSPDLSLPMETEVIRQTVLQALARYKGLEVVSVAEGAEMAISIAASRSLPAVPTQVGNFAATVEGAVETPVAVAVVIPGTPRSDGSRHPRVIWELSSTNVRGDPAPATGFAVDCFIRQLKKMRGEK